MGFSIERYWASPQTYTVGRQGAAIEWIVVHYTATQASALSNAVYFSGGNRGASAHYFIDDGRIVQSVDESDTAWHAGNWGMNTRSIGIEVVSDGRDFSEAEIGRLHWLVADIMRRRGIDAAHVIRHYDVADHASGNTTEPHKRCPAPYVDAGKWKELHETITEVDDMPSAREVAEAVWASDIDGWSASDRLRAANNYDYEGTDATGRGKLANYRDRLAFMAQKQEAMQESIDALDKKLDAVIKALG